MANLKLAKTDITPMLEQRMIRVMTDVTVLQTLTPAEIRAIYSELEHIRDALSQLLDRADDKL
jgi:hypothetical protein